MIIFYSEINQLNLDGIEKKEEAEKSIICRDTCPKHLLHDMQKYGEAKLSEFNNFYNTEEAMLEVYGSNDKAALDKLHLELDTLVSIVEIFTQVATFADDWFKKTLVDQGAIEWALNVMNVLK